MGAEVIKIEAPGQGDPGRTSELHTVLGQAKKAIILDLKKPEAVDIAKALVARADVLVENFATGVMDRLGLSFDALRAENPRLVYACVRGFGDPSTGRSPYADWQAYDVVAQAIILQQQFEPWCMRRTINIIGAAITEDVIRPLRDNPVVPHVADEMGEIVVVNQLSVAKNAGFLAEKFLDFLPMQFDLGAKFLTGIEK